jgi:hypothetical protein
MFGKAEHSTNNLERSIQRETQRETPVEGELRYANYNRCENFVNPLK